MSQECLPVNLHPSSPLYFDRLLAELDTAGQNSVAAFGRHVHWGYWSHPAEATLTVEDYSLAAEELCLQLLAAANVH